MTWERDRFIINTFCLVPRDVIKSLMEHSHEYNEKDEVNLLPKYPLTRLSMIKDKRLWEDIHHYYIESYKPPPFPFFLGCDKCFICYGH